MPQVRKYATRAEQQVAYRQRCDKVREAEMATKGLPSNTQSRTDRREANKTDSMNIPTGGQIVVSKWAKPGCQNHLQFSVNEWY